MSYLSHRTPWGRCSGLVAAAGLALCLAACNRESPTAVAVRNAENKIKALTPAGAQPASAQHRQKVYADIKKDLSGDLSSGTPSEIAAASILMSQSQAGLAQIPAAEAADLSAESLRDEVKARAVLDQWLNHMALADAAAKFDPTKELAALDADAQKLDQAMASAQARKAQIDKQVQDLRTQAQAKNAEAHGLQQQAGALRGKIPNETAVNGAQLLTQAREIGRRADALDVEGSNLEAQAAKVAPQSTEAQIEIDKITAQKALVAQAKAGVQKRAGEAKAQEQQARGEAGQVAKSLGELIQGLGARQEEIKKKTDDAISGYGSAVKSAKAGLNEMRSTAQMAAGAANQSSGDASWALGQSYAALAETLDTIAGAPHNMPGAAELKTRAEEARGAAKAALEAATESYKSAFEAYDKAGAKAEAGGVMEKLKQGLSANARRTSGGALDLMPPPEKPPEAEKPAESGAAAVAADQSTPQGTLQLMFDRFNSGDLDGGLALFDSNDPQQKQMLTAMRSLMGKLKALDDAMKRKFGKGMDSASGNNPMADEAMSQMKGMKGLKVSDLQIEVNGDSATARPPSGGQTLTLNRVGGKWMIDIASMGGSQDPQQMQMVQAMLPALGKAIDELIADIDAGKYPDADAASQALMQKMFGSMGGGMPGGMPKKGRGGGGG